MGKLQNTYFSRFQNRLIIWLATACLLSGALFFGGCKSADSVMQNVAATRELTDDLGRKVLIPVKIERAVSLAPNLTENIFAVGAGDKLVGVTSYCDYPEEAKEIAKIGDTLNPNMETIIALKPQIVFVSTASQIENFTKTLERQNIAVFVQDPKNLDGVLKNLEQLGEIFGTTDKSNKLTADLRSKIAAVQAKIKNQPSPKKVFVQIDKESLYTVGKDSFITDIVTRAGGDSATKDLPTGYPKISKENALSLNPDFIIISESPNNVEPNDVFKNSNAVKSGKVFKIKADLLSRPSPRIVDGLELLAADLHE